MDTLAQSPASLHFAEEREHADAACAHPGYGTEKQNHYQERRNTSPIRRKRLPPLPPSITLPEPDQISSS